MTPKENIKKASEGKSSKRIHAAFCFQNTSCGLRIRFFPPVTLETEDGGNRQAAGDLARLVPLLESWILQHPEEWELWDRL